MADVLSNYKYNIFSTEKELLSQKPLNKIHRVHMKKNLYDDEIEKSCWSSLCPCTCCKKKSQKDLDGEKLNLLVKKTIQDVENEEKKLKEMEAKKINDKKDMDDKNKNKKGSFIQNQDVNKDTTTPLLAQVQKSEPEKQKDLELCVKK